MNKEKMIYTEKGEGKSATEETRKGAKSKALKAKVATGYDKKGYGMHSIVTNHPKFKERLKEGQEKFGLKYQVK